MAGAGVPRWAWQLLAAVELYEAVHALGATCLQTVLDEIPSEVRATMRVMQENGLYQLKVGENGSITKQVEADG